MSRITDTLSYILGPPPERSTTFIIGTSVVTTLTLLSISRLAFKTAQKKNKFIQSPTVTLLPQLTSEEISALPYPPDSLPGGRDVKSPYGTIRVFEWGPEEGRKVLLVHGISTPCLSLGSIAHGLVERGCRVMLFDLWGRGYSDSPYDLPHDDRLYSTQILLAITSSALSWTGGANGGFDLIGYSLGGGISANFASYFPNMVNSLVLLAPTGILRPERMKVQRLFVFFANLVPEKVLDMYVKKRLQKPMFKKENKETVLEEVVEAEASGDTNISPSIAPASKKYPDITVIGSIAWHLHANRGFVHSFASSLLFAPIAGQQASWQRLGHQRCKVLIVTGSEDPISISKELKPDAEELLGKGNFKWREIKGAHDIPTTNCDKIVGEICAFLGI